MQHHARLANAESNEDADGVGRNEQCHHGVGTDEQERRSECDDDDADAVGESITALTNLTWQIAVNGQDAGELWAAVESGVGGKKQDARRCDLEDCVERPTPE